LYFNNLTKQPFIYVPQHASRLLPKGGEGNECLVAILAILDLLINHSGIDSPPHPPPPKITPQKIPQMERKKKLGKKTPLLSRHQIWRLFSDID